MSQHQVPVLIAGGGSVGLLMALFLARQGVTPLVVDSQSGPSVHPRATGLGPRTLEFLRESGLAAAVDAVAVDMPAGNLGKIAAATLAGAELAPLSNPETAQSGWCYERVSPATLRGTCPQHLLDSVLLPAVLEHGVTVRYSRRLVSIAQDDKGVTAYLDNGETVRADYLIAADGVHSTVRRVLDIGTACPLPLPEGALGKPKMNILFRADLTPYTRGRHFVACDITTPYAPGLLMTVNGVDSWAFHTAYDPELGHTADAFTRDRCAALVRAAVGDADLEVEVISRLPWRARALVADRFQDGRVFLVGDAAHAMPPLGAFGLNTGAADAHNLAWKLAAVLAGQAGAPLLETYEAERRPVALSTVEQAILRLKDPRLHEDFSPAAAARRAAVGMVNAPIVHLGYRYDSAAVIDPRPRPPATEDIELALDGAAGSRLPHVWVERDGGRVSTLDLIQSRFTVLTGPGGERWALAAKDVAERLAIPLTTVAVQTPEWLQRVGLAEDAALLVRPDQMIAWRSTNSGVDASSELGRVIRQLLSSVET